MDKDDRIVAAYPSTLSSSQADVLYGSLLGDGGVTLSVNGKTARYHEFHSFEQLTYLQWKQSVLKPFSGKIARSDKMIEDGRIAYGNYFNTCFHPVFLESYNSFYGSGVKRLPTDFEQRLSPMVMAAWYMDDGHLSDRNQDGVFTLSSGLPLEDIARIEVKMNEYGWDVESRTRSQDGITIFWINNKDRFYRFIEPHIHPSMRYKVPTSLRGNSIAGCKWKEHIEMFKADWESMDDEKRKEEVEKFFRYWRSIGFSYPYCDKDRREREMLALRNSKIDLDGDVIPTGHSQGTSLCLTFFDNFWSAHKKGGKSSLQVFEDDKMLRHVIADCMKYRKSLVESEIRAELQTFGGVHNFRPAVAKALMDRYCPPGGSVLDPCAGWGGRLLGFLVSGVSRYVGVDVERDTVKGLRMLAARIGKDIPGKSAEIVNSPFETLKLDEKFDLVFTSPPYFDAEWYGRGIGQSALQYPTYEQWRDKFLYPLIDGAVASLKAGGRLVLNVANVEGGPVADDARAKIASTVGIDRVLRMLLSSPYGNTQRHEDVIVSLPVYPS